MHESQEIFRKFKIKAAFRIQAVYQALPSVARKPNERWAIDLFRAWVGRDHWPTWPWSLTVTHAICGFGNGRCRAVEAALVQILIARYGCLGKVHKLFLFWSDNGLVFTSRNYEALLKSYAPQQEFITSYSPEHIDMVVSGIRTLKDQCVHCQRFENFQQASRVVGDGIGFYNHQRAHQ